MEGRRITLEISTRSQHDRFNFNIMDDRESCCDPGMSSVLVAIKTRYLQAAGKMTAPLIGLDLVHDVDDAIGVHHVGGRDAGQAVQGDDARGGDADG